jgi:hypothetical protein
VTTAPSKPLDPLVPWTLYLIGCAAFLGAFGVFGEAHHWRPEWNNYLDFIAACAFLGIAARMLIGWRFGKHRDLRQALIAIAAQRCDGVWVNRDAHLVFWGHRVLSPPIRMWCVVRMDEDVTRELDTGEPVRTAVTYERFICFPFTRGVVRTHDAALVTQDADGNIGGGELPGTPGTLVWFWRTLRMPRGMGTTWAQPDEVRELLSQFGATERVGDLP